MMDEKPKWGWWSINGEQLMIMLQRCHDGEEPFLVYAEAYANAEVERHGRDGQRPQE